VQQFRVHVPQAEAVAAAVRGPLRCDVRPGIPPRWPGARRGGRAGRLADAAALHVAGRDEQGLRQPPPSASARPSRSVSSGITLSDTSERGRPAGAASGDRYVLQAPRPGHGHTR
jgi:hypothetical protein